MPQPLPERPSLDWLRKTAKQTLKRMREARPSACLADAQLALAREYGFSSWRGLKAHVDRQHARAAGDDPRPITEALTGAFLKHVGVGRIDEVRRMLAETPVLVNAIGPHPFWGGRPQPLHVAIETGRTDMFELLLDAGADVRGTNDQYDHWTPLMVAISRDRTDMRHALESRGAPIGLIEALMLGDDDAVATYLSTGRSALPGYAPNGGTVLHFARTPYAVDLLLELGVPTDVKDRWGSTAIDVMSRMGPRGRTLVRHMVRRGIAAAPQEYARLGDREMLEALIEAEPAVARSHPVMMGAVDVGHHALVSWLIERGGDPNARATAQSRHTALHSAAWNGDLEMVRLLVNAGADVSARDGQYNATPQGWAEVSVDVTNNPTCREVAAFLESLQARGPS